MTQIISFAANDMASRLLTVDSQLPGILFPKPAPQCCWISAASAVLKTPVFPARNAEKSTSPNVERQSAAYAGAVM